MFGGGAERIRDEVIDPADHVGGQLDDLPGHRGGAGGQRIGVRVVRRRGLLGVQVHGGRRDVPALRAGVEEAHRQLDQPDTVGDGVVSACDDRAAAPKAVDAEQMPKRLVAIQGHGPLGADEVLESGIVTRLGQRHLADVVLEVDARGLFPVPGPVVAAHGHAAERRVTIPQPVTDNGP